MPPKKRKAAFASAQPAKRVRIDESSLIERSNQSTPSPTVRPKRSTAAETPQYNFTRRRTGKIEDDEDAADAAVDPPKKRGRPPKAQSQVEVDEKAVPVKGNLRRSSRQFDSVEAATPPKKRGRPPKASAAMKKGQGPTPPTSKSTETRRSATTTSKGNKGKKVPAAVSSASRGAALVDEPVEAEEESDGVINDGDMKTNEVDETVQYWLMKAEPDPRMENGHDVSFSIDDLAARTEPEAWDGVRNAVARNNMRAMLKGDLAFFYHSNCSIPGIVGVMRIVEEHSIDESAFDPAHPYYDPKSMREKPKWEVVKVEFVKKFAQMVTLKELRSFSQSGGALENMQVLRQSRLSVSSVSPSEWMFILDQAGEDHALGQPAAVDGYESDVDGEGDEDASAASEDDAGVDANGLGEKLVAAQPGEDGDDDDLEEGLEDEPKHIAGIQPHADDTLASDEVSI